MPLNGETYVIARNAWDRPTLQHRLVKGSSDYTGCGLIITTWSRAYQTKPIDAVLCKQKGCRA